MKQSNALAYEDREESDGLPTEVDHKLWPNARAGLLYLVQMLKSGDSDFVRTPRLMGACGLDSYIQFKKVHELMRGFLADEGFDLVNRLARDGGYAIARQPLQTFREVLKSALRSMGHLNSANVRETKLHDWLNQMGGDSREQFIVFKTSMGFLMANCGHMRDKIKEIQGALPELGDIAEEVVGIPDRLLAMNSSDRAKFIQLEPAGDAFDAQIAALEKAILATRVR